MIIKKYRAIFKEVPYFWLAVVTNALVLTFNFLYGRRVINAPLFLMVIFACNISMSLNVIRGVHGRLIGCAKSSELYNVLSKQSHITEGEDKRLFANKVAAALLVMSLVSLTLNILTPFLYKKNTITTTQYLIMLFTAYALSTVSTTFFTYMRIADRKVKALNSSMISGLNGERSNVVDGNKQLQFSRLEKCELILNFIIDSVTRFGEVGFNFLYASGRINQGVFIGLGVCFRLLDILLLSYSCYDRFKQLKLVEKDNALLKQWGDKKQQCGDIVKSNFTCMMLWCVSALILSSVGKTASTILYQQNKIGAPLYLLSTVIAITLGTSIMFAFNINRILDVSATDQNLSMLMGESATSVTSSEQVTL